ncbi:hypothetical protein ABZT16_43140 [Streptomyces flaveolus]|uniref:Uncharacterized protein n=1 Tax=Streptomyces flaveolus TaxID=67297 RepID=A0ABV3AM04_9ACTN
MVALLSGARRRPSLSCGLVAGVEQHLSGGDLLALRVSGGAGELFVVQPE